MFLPAGPQYPMQSVRSTDQCLQAKVVQDSMGRAYALARSDRWLCSFSLKADERPLQRNEHPSQLDAFDDRIGRNKPLLFEGKLWQRYGTIFDIIGRNMDVLWAPEN